MNAQILAVVYSAAIRHDILDFRERELATLGGIEKKTAMIVLVKPRWNHHNISDFKRTFPREYVLSLV